MGNITYRSIFLNKWAEHWVGQKCLVTWQLKKAFLLTSQQLPNHLSTMSIQRIFKSRKKRGMGENNVFKWTHVKYELSKMRGLEVQGPSNPERSLCAAPYQNTLSTIKTSHNRAIENTLIFYMTNYKLKNTVC
jgi:hypothetical protein